MPDLHLGALDERLLAPIWRHVSDPIDRVFARLVGYRRLVNTDCQYGCPIGYRAERPAQRAHGAA